MSKHQAFGAFGRLEGQSNLVACRNRVYHPRAFSQCHAMSSRLGSGEYPLKSVIKPSAKEEAC
jgi:hypothetical protein